MKDIVELTNKIVAFRDERDWKQFHAPNHLSAAIAVEAAELQEQFLWKNAKESLEQLSNPTKRQAVQDEIADVLILSLLLAHDLEIDVSQAITDKLQKNALKYPAEKSRGSAAKYSDH